MFFYMLKYSSAEIFIFDVKWYILNRWVTYKINITICLFFNFINFPVFNVADIYVTVAAVMLVILILFFYQEEDFDRIFPKKTKEGRREL